MSQAYSGGEKVPSEASGKAPASGSVGSSGNLLSGDEDGTIDAGSTTTGNGDKPALDLDLSGRQMGDYRLLRRLGRGAMADVYLAEQGSLRRQVALKTLKRELAADQTYVRPLS